MLRRRRKLGNECILTLLRTVTTNSKEFHQVVELTMDIATYQDDEREAGRSASSAVMGRYATSSLCMHIALTNGDGCINSLHVALLDENFQRLGAQALDF